MGKPTSKSKTAPAAPSTPKAAAGTADDRIAALEAQLAAMKAAGGRLKVQPKGTVSVYGFGRWPITLWPSQWEQLHDRIDEIANFVASHRGQLDYRAARFQVWEAGRRAQGLAMGSQDKSYKDAYAAFEVEVSAAISDGKHEEAKAG